MEKKKSKLDPNNVISKYTTQPISQPDSRQEKTGVALPNDENVIRNKNWVDENGLS